MSNSSYVLPKANNNKISHPIESSESNNVLNPFQAKMNKIHLRNKSFSYSQKILSKADSTLMETQSLIPVRPSKYSIILKDVLSKDTLNNFKKEQYNKRWNLKSQIIASNRSNIRHNSILRGRMCVKRRNTNEMLERLYGKRKNQSYSVIIGDKHYDVLQKLPSFEPPTGIREPHIIFRDSLAEACANNVILKYENMLKEKVGNYIEYAEKFSNLYDLDQAIIKDIKNKKIGVSVPGNFLNYIDDPNKFSFIKVIHPACVKSKIKKHIVVPERTQLPKPFGLKKYKLITMKQLYKE